MLLSKMFLKRVRLLFLWDYYKTNPNKEYQTGMIVADVEIGEQVYTCVVTVCLNNEGLIRVWNHEVTPYPNTKPQDASLTNHVFGGETTSHQHQGAMAKVAKEYQKNNNTNEIKNINMKKNVVKINENTLRQIVAESVKKVLRESYEDSYEYIDDNIKKILEHIHGISDVLFQIHETANVKDKNFTNFDDIISTLMMHNTDFRDEVMEMGVKYGLAKGRETF